MEIVFSYMVIIKFLVTILGIYSLWKVFTTKAKNWFWNILTIIFVLISVFIPITHKTDTTKIEYQYDNQIKEEVQIQLPEKVKPEKSFSQIDKEIKHIPFKIEGE